MAKPLIRISVRAACSECGAYATADVETHSSDAEEMGIEPAYHAGSIEVESAVWRVRQTCKCAARSAA
jgi:hypothetical protein